jgi:hypothetical protein
MTIAKRLQRVADFHGAHQWSFPRGSTHAGRIQQALLCLKAFRRSRVSGSRKYESRRRRKRRYGVLSFSISRR